MQTTEQNLSAASNGFPVMYTGGYNDCNYIDTRLNLSNLREEVKDVESQIKQSVHNHQISNNQEFRAIQHDICEVDKNVQKEVLLNRFEIERSERRVKEKVDRETDQIKRDIQSFHHHTDKQFCELKNCLEKGFFEIKERELVCENKRLQEELMSYKMGRKL
jgi:mevalonate kinase